MAGQGIQYPAPREDVPIFDPLLFLEQDLGPLTEAIADTKYLRFPFAQGTENMADMNVSGTATFFDALTHTGANGENVTTNQNIIMNGTVGKFLQFPDGTQQTTAATGGGSNVLSTQTILTNQNITFPVGTQFATIMISGAGGASGGAFFDPTVPSVTAGGAGGAGGCAIINRMPMEAGTNMICVFTGGQVNLGYLARVNTAYVSTNYPLAVANAGADGTTAVTTGGNPAGGVGGTIGITVTGMGYGLQGSTGGAGQQSSTTFAVLQGINLLSTVNQNMVISTITTPFNYGAGGYTRINDGATNNVTINNPGSAVCIVISYSS